MSRSTRRRATQVRRAERRRPLELHIFSFAFAELRGFRGEASVLVRGKMGQNAAISLAYDQAGRLGHGAPFCPDIRTVPAPRATPALDALTARCTSFGSLTALLTAPAGYRPSLRLDLLGRDGGALARAYDRAQAAWGDPRRAFLSPAASRAGRHGRPAAARVRERPGRSPVRRSAPLPCQTAPRTVGTHEGTAQGGRAMTVECALCGAQWPRDPALETGCPDCLAPVGQGCRRPSGHGAWGRGAPTRRGRSAPWRLTCCNPARRRGRGRPPVARRRATGLRRRAACSADTALPVQPQA